MTHRTLAAAIALVFLFTSCGAAEPDAPAFTEPEEAIAVEGVSPGTILDFFSEVAIGSEYGESADVLCRWTHRIRYYLKGDVTGEDRSLIDSICDRLNGIEGFPGIFETDSEVLADLTVSFVPQSEIRSTFPEAGEGCTGMASYVWDSESGSITKARSFVDSSLTTERANTLCEEFLQALGPARDSYMFPNSVFYQGYTLTPFPTELDFAILRILYSPKLTTGAPRAESLSRAAALLAWE